MTTPPDLSELLTLSSRAPQACKVQRTREKLDKERQAMFDAGIQHPDITCAAWVEWFAKHTGVRMSGEIVRRHRMGQCGCARD